jgi:hypothetical protein
MTAAQKQETPIVTTKNSDTNKFTKITLIVFAVVFLIILSEVAYLVFAKPGNSILNLLPTNTKEESERTILNQPPKPTLLPLQENQENVIDVNSIEGYALIDDLDRLAVANRLETSDLATIYTELSGTVMDAYFVDEERDGIKYVYYLKIKRGSGQIQHFLNEEEAVVTQVVILEGGVEKQGSLTSIQKGDVITVTSTLNLLDENPYQSVILKITR